jgi:hypothetical protein
MLSFKDGRDIISRALAHRVAEDIVLTSTSPIVIVILIGYDFSTTDAIDVDINYTLTSTIRGRGIWGAAGGKATSSS